MYINLNKNIMINLEKIEGNEIEKFLGPLFNSIDFEPLNNDHVFKIFMNLNLVPDFQKIENILKSISDKKFRDELENHFNSVINRFSILGFNVDEKIVIFIVLAITIWGNRSLIIAYIIYCFYKNSIEGNNIKFDFFVEKCIPLGIPTNNWYERTWDKQKIKINNSIGIISDNLVDCIDAYKSLKK